MGEDEKTEPLLVWAHQGGAREGPSNTREAMDRALEAGVEAIELDVHRTTDGTLVVCHDARVDRTTDDTGRIRDMTCEEVQALDAAHWWAPGQVVVRRAERRQRPDGDFPLRWTGSPRPGLAEPVRIPTLREVDALLRRHEARRGAPIPVTIELKGRQTPGPLARELSDPETGWPCRPVTVVSFWTRRVEQFEAELGPDPTTWERLGTAPGTGALIGFWLRSRFTRTPGVSLQHVRRLQMKHRAGPVVLADRRFVAAAHRQGLAVDVWTVDDPTQLERMLADDVDGLMTDSPVLIRRMLGRDLPAPVVPDPPPTPPFEVTTLRVHGVGGSPGPDVIGLAPLPAGGQEEVPRDDPRRGPLVFDGGAAGTVVRQGHDASDHVLEVLDWGDLNAGRARRGWVLLTPFTLLNAASWMVGHAAGLAPATTIADLDAGDATRWPGPRRLDERVTRALVLVLGGLMTFTLSAWVVDLVLNVVFHQVVGAGDGDRAWTAAGLATCLALVGVVAVVVRRGRTSHRREIRELGARLHHHRLGTSRSPDPDPEPLRVRLRRAGVAVVRSAAWLTSGLGPVGRTTAGWATDWGRGLPERPPPRGRAWRRNHRADRAGAPMGRPLAHELVDEDGPWAAAPATHLAIALAAVAAGAWTALRPAEQPAALATDGPILVALAATVAVLVAIGLLTVTSASSARRCGPVLSAGVVAALLVSSLPAGVGLTVRAVADAMGRDVVDGRAVVLVDAYLGALVGIVLVGVAFAARSLVGGSPSPPADADPAVAAAHRAGARLARVATQVHQVDRWLAAVALATGAGAAAVLLTHLDRGDRWYRLTVVGEHAGGPARAVAYLLCLATGALVLWLSRDRQTSLKLPAHVWDVLCLFPRRTHPLGVQPYGPLVLPVLRQRIFDLRFGRPARPAQPATPGRPVIVSAHSQGSVLALVALTALPRREIDGVALVTYGTPLPTLHRRAFPGWFHDGLYRDLRHRLDGRWCSFGRATDPVGGPFTAVDRAIEGRLREDALPDPMTTTVPAPAGGRRGPGTEVARRPGVKPFLAGHSHYLGEPRLQDAVADLARELTGRHVGTEDPS